MIRLYFFYVLILFFGVLSGPLQATWFSECVRGIKEMVSPSKPTIMLTNSGPIDLTSASPRSSRRAVNEKVNEFLRLLRKNSIEQGEIAYQLLSGYSATRIFTMRDLDRISSALRAGMTSLYGSEWLEEVSASQIQQVIKLRAQLLEVVKEFMMLQDRSGQYSDEVIQAKFGGILMDAMKGKFDLEYISDGNSFVQYVQVGTGDSSTTIQQPQIYDEYDDIPAIEVQIAAAEKLILIPHLTWKMRVRIKKILPSFRSLKVSDDLKIRYQQSLVGLHKITAEIP